MIWKKLEEGFRMSDVGCRILNFEALRGTYGVAVPSIRLVSNFEFWISDVSRRI